MGVDQVDQHHPSIPSTPPNPVFLQVCILDTELILDEKENEDGVI